MIPGGIVEWIQGNLLPEALATILLFVLVAIFRNKIVAKARDRWYYYTNEEIQMSIKRIDKFESEPADKLDQTLYRELKENSNIRVSNPEVAYNRLTITPEDIPTKVVVSLEEDVRFQGMEKKVVGYKLITETDHELRFGYKTDDSLKKFENLSGDIAEMAKTLYFPGENPSQSYVLARLTKGAPASIEEKIEDEELGLRLTVQGDDLQMRFKDPKNLSEGVRRYFRPT